MVASFATTKGEIMDKCLFCEKAKTQEKLLENDSCYAVFDGFPVSPGHVLIISKRHAQTFFDLTENEQHDMIDLLNKCKLLIDEKYNPQGYNVGLNCGLVAGQSIMHVHMHLIPRYTGDVENPRGGVRGVIPAKRNY